MLQGQSADVDKADKVANAEDVNSSQTSASRVWHQKYQDFRQE